MKQVRCTSVWRRQWLAASAVACGAGLAVPGQAHEAVDMADSPSTTALPKVHVTAPAPDVLGLTDSVSSGVVSADALARRPRQRTGEVLEAVPGLIVTQHAGGGKANQYFLRGWNLDHGTDFATLLDGIPLNLGSHGHGQGYTDLNLVVPELLQEVRYSKGTGQADSGDFASAGTARLATKTSVARPFAQLEAGMYGYGRLVAAASPHLAGGHLLIGGELLHHDGPWLRPDNYLRGNMLVRWSGGSERSGWTLGLHSHAGTWQSTDQVAASAIVSGQVSRWGNLDPDTGGRTRRHLVSASWHRRSAAWQQQAQIWGGRYDFRLVSNFTYFASDPAAGDEFAQEDGRWQSGGHWQLEWHGKGLLQRPTRWRLGTTARLEQVDNALLQTVGGVVRNKLVDGTVVRGVTRSDEIWQGSVGLWSDWQVLWPGRLQSVVGLRGDAMSVDVRSHQSVNTGGTHAALLSPKLTLAWLAHPSLTLYAEAGSGFHSNDARGAVQRRDPVTAAPVQPSNLLVRSLGAETGVRWAPNKTLLLTLSGWWLRLDSELLFVGDAGTTEASRPSERLGAEATVRWQPRRTWLLDIDAAWSRSHFLDALRDEATGALIGQAIPGAVQGVVAMGVTHDMAHRLQVSARLRWFGPRPLLEDASLSSPHTTMVSGQIRWAATEHWALTLVGLNLLNRRDDDITYAYESRTSPQAPLRLERHLHPVEPIQVRLGLVASW